MRLAQFSPPPSGDSPPIKRLGLLASSLSGQVYCFGVFFPSPFFEPHFPIAAERVLFFSEVEVLLTKMKVSLPQYLQPNFYPKERSFSPSLFFFL